MNMNLLKYILVALSLLALIVLVGCEDEPDPVKEQPKNGLTVGDGKSFTIALSHAFGSENLKLSPAEFITINDTIKLSELRYYISNVTLTNDAGNTFNLGTYHLVDFDPIAVDFLLNFNNAPKGNYKRLSFLVGVDSVSNSSGAQEGALDPNNGMFWTWNTGYIFFKARGRYSASGSFALDIGGTSNAMQVSIDLSNSKPVTSAVPEVLVKFDLQKAFNAPNPYNLGIDADQIHNSGNGSIPKLKPNIINAFTFTGIK